jgi:hypothetical protein
MPPAALDIEVTLRETAGETRAGELVSFGVPIAESAGVTAADQLRLVDATGATVPAQIEVTARWGGPPQGGRPARWVLVHAKADLAAGATATLRLRKAGAVSGTPMAVVDDTTGITVDTGVIRVEVSRQHATVLDSLVRDGVELLDPADADHGLLVTDRSGQVLRSADAEVLSTEVERTGPLTTTVHQLIEMDDVRLRDEHRETWGTNACFDWLYSCSELQRYRLRVDVWSEFTAGSDDVRLRARVANASVCPVTEDGVKHCAVPGSLNSIGWEDLTIRLGSARVLGSATTGGATAPVGSGSLVSHQESSGLDSWAYYTQLAPIGSNGYDPGGWEERLGSHVAYRGYRTSAAGTVLDSGDRAPGWLTASAGTGPALGIVTPDPWKRYPIALRADSGGVELGWYPGEFAAQYSMRPGERHTVELAVVADAGGGASSRTALRALADPIRWSIDPADLAASGALPRLAPVGEDAGYDTWNMASVDRSISQAHHPQPSDASSVLWARDRFNMWGKLEAGYLPNDNEARTSTDLSKYGQYQGFLLQSLRGDGGPTWADVWWEMAVDANRAQADSGYLITPTADPGSLWPGIDMAHCFHENAENVTYPRGGGFGCDFAGDLGGMVLHHHMTGWEPDRDAIDAHLAHVRVRAAGTAYDGEARAFASMVDVLVDGYAWDGDLAHLQAANALVARMSTDGGDRYLDCPCPGDTGSINALFVGWLLDSLGRLADAWEVARGTASPEYGVARSALDRHAAWMADDVAFATTVDGTPVVAMPYYWYHDGRSANRAPAMTAYELMTVDGLAAAYEHTGTVRYLTVAGQLFDGAILYPFGTGWTPFVYSTINEAGKFATFGGRYLRVR